jgi:transposase
VITLHLTEAEIDDIAEALDDPEITDRIKTKLLVIRMHHEGAANTFIGKVLGLSINTPVAYIKQYRSGGLAELIEDRYYRPSSSLEPFWDCLRCSFAAVPSPNAKEAMVRIEKLTGVRLSESQVRRNMKRLGLVWRKTAPLPGKADPQLQFDFYTKEMAPRLAEAAAGTRKVFFIDAAHFVLGSFLGMMWCYSRVFIKTSPGRQRYNVLGAVDSHSKNLITIRSTDNVNAMTVCALLRKIRRYHPDIEITLILDNVRYQHSREVTALADELGIELLYLPAYSPNLNLIERLWRLVKKECLVNRFYPDFTQFREAIDSCLDNLTRSGKKLLHSLLTLNFQFFPIHKF